MFLITGGGNCCLLFRRSMLFGLLLGVVAESLLKIVGSLCSGIVATPVLWTIETVVGVMVPQW